MNTSNKNSKSDKESITPKAMETTKDTAVKQHQNDENADKDQYNHIKDKNLSNKETIDDNDDINPNFEENTQLNHELDEDLKNNNDPNRRTLDEYNAVTPDNPKYDDGKEKVKSEE